jgi:hypothetical protein
MSNSLVEILEEVRSLIQEDDLRSAGAVLFDVSDSLPNRFRNEILVYTSNIKQLLNDQRKGIGNSETSASRKRQLMFSILDLLDEISDKLSTEEKKEMFSAVDRFSSHTKKIIFGSSVGQVIIQNSLEGNNTVENQQKNFSISGVGGSVNISAPIAIADSIENSFNQLSDSNVKDDIKSLLENLLATVNEINKTVPPDQSETAQAMARDAETLVNEVTSSKPRRKWYELGLEGLKEAAESLGSVALPVITIVEKIAGLLAI